VQKLRRRLCSVDAHGHVTLRQDVEWPAFMRYNASRLLDEMGQKAVEYDMLDLMTIPREQIFKVDAANSKGVLRAREKAAHEQSAGPDWHFLPRLPELKSRPDLRKDLKMLTRRHLWDPQQRVKSLGWDRAGGSTKSPNRLSYPKYLGEGYVVLDKNNPSQNLPRRLRFKSLTTQVLADPEIRKRLHERYRYLFFSLV
jgi:hypothetical protein